MKKLISLIVALCAFAPHFAAAQQYVSPLYPSNSIQPYPLAPVANTYAYAAPTAAPAPAIYGNTGYGTANYGNADMASTIYTSPNDPAQKASYATYAAVPPRPTYSGYNWNGCYIGGYGGGAFGSDIHAKEAVSQGGAFVQGTPYNATSAPYGYDLGSQAIGGGTLGCNFDIPQHMGPLTGLVLGVEGEGGSFSLSSSTTNPNSRQANGDTQDKTHLGDWDAVAAGRLGMAFDRTLVYGKFGAAFMNANSSVTDTCTTTPCGARTINASGHKQLVDAAVGGGVEYALSNVWSVKGEYMYFDTTDSYPVCGAGGGAGAGSVFCSQHTLTGTHTIKVGLNYHFNDMFDDRGGTAPRW